MNDHNEKQLAENMNADSPDTRPELQPRSSLSPKGRGEETTLSPRMKILLRIILIVFLFGLYAYIVGTVNYLRVGIRGKMGDEIASAAAVRKLLEDNPSVFFTGEAHVMFACTWIPELKHRWYGLFFLLKWYTFTVGWDDKEWNLYVFTEKVEDVENIKRNLASMIPEFDRKSSDLCIRHYHVYFYHSWPPPSTCNPDKIAQMSSYADYRLDIDNL